MTSPLDLFYKEMADRAKAARQDFGVPDKVFTGDEAKLWRFTATVIPSDPDTVFFNPTPVYSGDRIVGAANVVAADHGTYDTHVTVDYHIPERLDTESWGLTPELSVVFIDGRVALRFK